MKVGVLAVQGAVSEHLAALKEADPKVEAVPVRGAAELAGCVGLIIPGGESTTISRLLRSSGLHDLVAERAKGGDLAVYGTCAGMVLVSSKATHDVDDKDVRLLGLLDAEVDRNAFGRQKDSFESQLEVDGVGPVPAVYIRAPVITRVWGQTKVLASTERGIVVVQKGRVLASAFHPELTPDRKMHRHFLRLCAMRPGARP